MLFFKRESLLASIKSMQFLNENWDVVVAYITFVTQAILITNP